nr:MULTISPECIES: molybdopterin-synthase adenylyltransferase MoeB [unclassified Sphingomonas]
MEAVILADEELDRYARHIILKEIGGDGQRRLKAATALIIGAGGIGSPAIQYLAAAGIGRLVIVDDDRVEASNLQRQTIFSAASIGARKAEAAAEAALRLNPLIEAVPDVVRLDGDNAESMVADADVVIDGSDNFDTRLTVADTAHAARVPLVSAAVGQFDGQLATFRGWEAGKPCYRCFVGGDPAQAGATCADDGVLGPVTGVMGSLAALEAIRAIVPFGEDTAGKLLLVDALSWRFRTLNLPKDPGCRTCGQQ